MNKIVIKSSAVMGADAAVTVVTRDGQEIQIHPEMVHVDIDANDPNGSKLTMVFRGYMFELEHKRPRGGG